MRGHKARRQEGQRVGGKEGGRAGGSKGERSGGQEGGRASAQVLLPSHPFTLLLLCHLPLQDSHREGLEDLRVCAA